MLKGGCFCGALRYEAHGTPFHETSCHCSICRRTTGAPFVTWFSVPRAAFRWARGEPVRFASTAHGTRSFCGRCGTQVLFESTTAPDELDVTAGSLDDPESIPPKDHSRTSSRLAWIKLADGLPEYSEGRSERS
jgi:hypothetical protein